MNTIPSHCGGMMHGANSETKLCTPLEQLKKEHVPLMEKMNHFHMLANEIGVDSNVADWKTHLRDLQEKVTVFIDELEPHSLREEDVLFPMMARYIGRQTGPIAVMEFEHEQAKENLHNFMKAMEKVAVTVEHDEAKSIAAYVIEAYTILSAHFMKEEVVLFPMAEQMLSLQEKEYLSHKFQEL